MIFFEIILAHLNPTKAPSYNRGGVQFVKPRVYETGGGEWKLVRDETENISLEEKLSRMGISQNSTTQSSFGQGLKNFIIYF